jgi:peptidoglycan/xylan/chitin deacetylase (PgdA/CDA1 family)
LKLKRAIKTMLSAPVGWALSAPLRLRGALVLMYHRVGPSAEGFGGLDVSEFRAQMTWLKQNCTPIGPEQLLDSVARARRLRPVVLVTFDDGYRDYHDHAYPILKELAIPALVFVSTVFMDEPERLLWPDLLHLAAQRARPGRVSLPWEGGAEFDLDAEDGRRRLVRAAKDHVKEIAEEAKEAALHRLYDGLGFDPAAARVERQMLSWDEVRATLEFTTYGGHTHTHPILSRISGQRAEVEVRTCRDRLLAETGRATRHFAYPNGRNRDFTEETKAILLSHGFDIAYTAEKGVNDASTDWMAVKRIPAPTSLPDFAWALAALTSRDR